jgi:Na+/proline symporter
MIASAGLFTENIYRPLAPGRPQGHYVTVGRIASVVVVSGGVACAYAFRDVVEGLEIFWKISAMMGLAFWLGLFWRRMTTAGAWATTLVGFAVMLFTSVIAFGEHILWDFDAHFAAHLPEFMLFDGRLNLPWQMILYLAAGLISGVVVSLLTRPVPAEKLENFYALTRTPVTLGEQVDKPCTLPAGAVVPERRNLLPNTSLEIAIPSRMSVIGFLAGWACVAAIVIFVYRIANG